MQTQEQPIEPQNRKSRLKRLIRDAFDVAAQTPDMSVATVDFIADAIIARRPSVDQLTDIVKEALEATGEGVGHAAEAAGDVAGAIAEGLGSALSA